jgi:hypothetical protein
MLKGSRRFIFRRIPPEDFKIWLNGYPEIQNGSDIIMFGTRPHRNGRNIVDRAELQAQLTSNPHPQRFLVITKEQPHNQIEPADMLCFDEYNVKDRVELNQLIFECNPKYQDPCTICNVAIRYLRFVYDMKSTVRLVNCWIEKLSIHPGSRLNIEIINSHIAHWELQDACCNNLSIQSSSLGSVSRGGGETKAIVGNARFAQLVTPRGRSWYEKQVDAADQWAQAS